MLLIVSFLPISSTAVVQVAVPLLACQQVESEEKWLFTDMSQHCWEGTHRQVIFFLVVPGLVVTVAMPLLVVFVAALRGKEHASGVYFQFWTSGYKLQCWSVVVSGMKITSIWLATNAITYSKLMQVTAVLGVIIVLCVLNVFFRRALFTTNSAFLMAQCSLLIVAVSTYICACFMSSEPGNLAFDYCIGLIFLLLNGGFLVGCGYCLMCRRRDVHVVPSQELSQSQIMIVPQNSVVEEISNN